jgi:hypothetical protein
MTQSNNPASFLRHCASFLRHYQEGETTLELADDVVLVPLRLDPARRTRTGHQGARPLSPCHLPRQLSPRLLAQARAELPDVAEHPFLHRGHQQCSV